MKPVVVRAHRVRSPSAAALVAASVGLGVAQAQQPNPTQAAESVLHPQVMTIDDTSPERRRATETTIEQRRQGNRVAEVVVSPAGTTYSYVLRNREGRTPTSRQDLSSGLSTPSFIHFEF